MIEAEVRRVVDFHTAAHDESEWNVEEVFETMKALAFGISNDVYQKLTAIKAEAIDDDEKKTKIEEYLLATVKEQYEERERVMGKERMREVERMTMLRSIDMLWMDHLDQMEHLRDSVRLRAYGQRDPLVEYKNEGGKLFHELQKAIRTQIVNNIFKVGAIIQEENRQRIEFRKPESNGVSAPERTSLLNVASHNVGQQSLAPQKEPNRNDPCPCGSGKKYKRCHGA